MSSNDRDPVASNIHVDEVSVPEQKDENAKPEDKAKGAEELFPQNRPVITVASIRSSDNVRSSQRPSVDRSVPLSVGRMSSVNSSVGRMGSVNSSVGRIGSSVNSSVGTQLSTISLQDLTSANLEVLQQPKLHVPWRVVCEMLVHVVVVVGYLAFVNCFLWICGCSKHVI